ncbi:jg19311, partial [Pararge aegeria aegeria]
VVTASADATREKELRAHNEFARPFRVLAVTLPDDVAKYFQVSAVIAMDKEEVLNRMPNDLDDV